MATVAIISCVLLLAVLVHPVTDLTLPDIFFPFGTDVGDKIVPVEDDGSSPEIKIATGFPLFHVIRYAAYVSTPSHCFCVLGNVTCYHRLVRCSSSRQHRSRDYHHRSTVATSYLLTYLYLWVDGPASSLAYDVHIVRVLAVVGVLEGVDRLCIDHCHRETIPTIDHPLTEEELPCVES